MRQDDRGDAGRVPLSQRGQYRVVLRDDFLGPVLANVQMQRAHHPDSVVDHEQQSMQQIVAGGRRDQQVESTIGRTELDCVLFIDVLKMHADYIHFELVSSTL